MSPTNATSSEPIGAPSLYAAFDRYPSSKGAAVHIREFADTLFESCGGGLLHVLGGEDLPSYQREVDEHGRTVEIVRFTESIPNLLDRVDAYGRQLAAVAAAHRNTLKLVHVRDPWSAAPLLLGDAPATDPAPRSRAPLVFEVNGLPSIELPYAYPGLGERTLTKVRQLEVACLEGAAAIVTPSAVLAERLRALAPAAAPITVVRNGAKLPDELPPRPEQAPARYIVYVGALQPWQGIDTLLAALRRLADLDVQLVVCSATPPKRARPWRRLAARLGVEDRVDWHFKVPHREVAAWLTHAELSVAPLSDCARNVDQGCCPLKVLESMAAGTAVIASDLAVTRELVVDGEHGRLVPPDRPAELARAIRVALELPELTAAQGRAAQGHVRRSLTWQHSRDALGAVYEEVAQEPRSGGDAR